MNSSESMTFEYPVMTMDFSTAGEASSNIKKILRQLGMDAAVIRRVAIATYEAEINVAIHSNGGKIKLEIYADKIKVIAEDQGPGIADINLAMQQGYSTATNEVRELGFGAGMGLPNMKKCCDEFTIESVINEFTRVEMTILI